ncbi:MAG: phosphotransferase family protein [Deltaproteobacteria bacterium]|nr:phosphotransferase family protein [Deltaproteobacteria bacterium]
MESWLASKLPPGSAPQVSALEVPSSNGMSSETVLFGANWREQGRTRTESLVARVAPDAAAVPVFPVYDLECQFQVMRLVGANTTVPVPHVYWSEPDSGPLGAPFFVMKRVEGQVPPDIMPYNFGSWVSEATAEEQARLQKSSVNVLARLHEIAQPERTFAFLQSKQPEPTALRRQVAELWAYYEWVREDLRVPLIERCFTWLQEHWPKDEGETVLSWGDARIGNIMYRQFEPVAVFDWEMAALGPRELDLGWMIFMHRFFEDIAAKMGLPGMPHFLRRDDVAATYESLSGHTPRDLDFYTMYAALRHGIIMSRIQRRAIHFGEATMPEDVDDLIMHRATLEAMLAGTYWK